MPIPLAKNKYYDNENVNQYNSAIKSFCAENKFLFIDMLDLLDNNDLNEDGLHPNSIGHKKMFERISDFIISKKLVSNFK
ncbi:MAG: GDSL-type esterase/lipase family protein [bacterium]